jgi:hypothetical protein
MTIFYFLLLSGLALYTLSTDRIENTAYNSSCILVYVSVFKKTRLLNRCLEIFTSSFSVIPAFGHHVTILLDNLLYPFYLLFAIFFRLSVFQVFIGTLHRGRYYSEMYSCASGHNIVIQRSSLLYSVNWIQSIPSYNMSRQRNLLSYTSRLRGRWSPREGGVVWRLPEPSDSKIWSWVPWDSEPRITVLARTSCNLAVSQWSLKSKEEGVETDPGPGQ